MDVSPAAPWPAGLKYAIFSVGDGRAWACTLFYPHHFVFIFFYPWKVISPPAGEKRSPAAVHQQLVQDVVHVLACTVVIVNFDVAVRGLRGGCLLLGVAVIYHALKTPPSSLGSGKGRGQMILV